MAEHEPTAQVPVRLERIHHRTRQLDRSFAPALRRALHTAPDSPANVEQALRQVQVGPLEPNKLALPQPRLEGLRAPLLPCRSVPSGRAGASAWRAVLARMRELRLPPLPWLPGPAWRSSTAPGLPPQCRWCPVTVRRAELLVRAASSLLVCPIAPEVWLPAWSGCPNPRCWCRSSRSPRLMSWLVLVALLSCRASVSDGGVIGRPAQISPRAYLTYPPLSPLYLPYLFSKGFSN